MTMTNGTMTKNGRKHRPLIIKNGKDMTDPNFDEYDEPKDKESADATYAQSSKNTIKGNIYDYCKGACVILGLRPKNTNTVIPKNNEFKSNKLIAYRKSYWASSYPSAHIILDFT